MITRVTEAAIRKVRGEYQHQVSQLPDLTDEEQKAIVEVCVAYFQNHEGEGVVPAGIINLANGIRSRRAARKEAADWRFETMKRQGQDWVKAHFPEATNEIN